MIWFKLDFRWMILDIYFYLSPTHNYD